MAQACVPWEIVDIWNVQIDHPADHSKGLASQGYLGR